MKNNSSIILWGVSTSAAAVLISVLYMTLWVPPDAGASSPSDIVLAKAVNSIDHRNAGQINWNTARPGLPLQENDAIRAGRSSMAEIQFGEDAAVVLSENSLIIIKRLGGTGAGGSGTQLVLDEGRVQFVASKGSGSVKIRTAGDLEVDVSGSTGTISAGKETTQLDIESGTARISTASGDVEIQTDEGQAATLELSKSGSGSDVQVAALSGRATVARDGAVVNIDNNTAVKLGSASQPESVVLPPAPDLKSGNLVASIARVSLGDAQFSWSPVADSVAGGEPLAYKVRIYDKRDPSSPVKTVDTERTSYTPTDLAPGDYFYTVASVRGGVIGAESSPFDLTIALPPAPRTPWEALEYTEADVATGDPTITWSPAEESTPDERYRVRVFDAENQAQPVIEAEVESTRYAIKELEPGDYIYQVSTLVGQYEGRPSGARLLSVIGNEVLAPPRPSQRSAATKITYEDTPPRITVDWNAADERQKRFRLQVARRSNFAPESIVFEQDVDQSAAGVQLRSGNYFWRVASLAGRKTLGEYSTPGQIEVRKIVPPAVYVTNPMKYDVVFEPQLEIRGKTEKDNQVELRMVWAGNQQLQVDDQGNYSKTVQLRRGRNKFTVAIENPAGKQAERVHEILLAPQAVARSPSFAETKEEIDKLNTRLRRVYQTLEKLRIESQSDLVNDTEIQEKARKAEAYRDQLESLLKERLAQLEAFVQ